MATGSIEDDEENGCRGRCATCGADCSRGPDQPIEFSGNELSIIKWALENFQFAEPGENARKAQTIIDRINGDA